MKLINLILMIIEKFEGLISNFHAFLFRKLPNNLIINFKFIGFFQQSLAKIYLKFKKKNPFNSNFYVRHNLAYKFSTNILETYFKDNININLLIKNLDSLSKKIYLQVFSNIFYVYTHGLLDKRLLKNVQDKTLNINNKDFSSDNFKIKTKFYEHSVFFYDCGLKFVPDNSIHQIDNKDIIDGGAYFGDSALIFEKRYDSKQIHAFEPDKKWFSLLLKNIKKEQLKRINPINMGLGAKEERLNLRSTGGAASHISKKGNSVVKITTIDNFVSKNNLSLGLIKLDIEGFAFKALNGAKSSLRKFHPVLLISIYHNGDEFFKIIRFLKEITPEYKIIIRRLNPSDFFLETTLIAWKNNN